MKMRNRVFALFILMCGSVTSIRGGPNVRFVPSPTHEITITPANADYLPGFDSSAVSKFHPAAFILTNQSSRAIVGLAVRWVYVDQNGRQGFLTHKSDSFSMAKAIAVMSPRTRLLVAPGVFLPEALAQSPHIGPPLEALDGRAVQSMQDASEITIQIDCVIFEDGEVVGPNQSNYDTEIQNRKIAAEQLAKQVRNAEAKGQDSISVASQIIEAAREKEPPDHSDTLSLWNARFAQKLLRSPMPEAQLKALESMPALPKFYRTTSSGGQP
jgi:hypothetical protein